jgi:hypothetical protein
MRLVRYSAIAVLSILTTVTLAEQPNRRGAEVRWLGKAVSMSDLEKQRGGNEIVLNHVDAKGTVTDNFASDILTGTNSITGSAFSGASGIPLVIQNTGNNVLIQNATIINLQVK